MDAIARYNRERWDDLVRAGVAFSLPALELDRESARVMVDPEGVLGDLAGADVLCLAGGGGQQTAAFALLGARVSVLDFCEGQLERDLEAAAHYGTQVHTVEGDMRDLSPFGDDAFDVVWQAHSLNFVPDPRPVFSEVARVLRPGGRYRLECTNPFVHGLWSEPWTDAGYPLRRPYVDGAEIVHDEPGWKVRRPDGSVIRVAGPREWRHALSTLSNELVRRGFLLRGIWEDSGDDREADPDTWPHFKTIAPPWLTFWWTLVGASA